MEKIIGSFFLVFILLLLYLNSFSIKKRYFRKSSHYRKKIKNLKSQKNVLDNKLEITPISKKEVNDLAIQVLDLHKSILENKIK